MSEPEEEVIERALKETNLESKLDEIEQETKEAEKNNDNKALEEVKNKGITLGKDVITKMIEYSGNSSEIKKMVTDAIDKFTGEPNTDIKIWSDVESKITGLDKSLGTKCLNTLKYPFEKMYNAFSSFCDYFTSDEGKVKKLALDKFRETFNNPDSSADEKIEAYQNYAENIKDISSELDKSDQKGESKYGEKLWSLLKLLFVLGGVIAVLAVVAKSLNGCYQYKIGINPLKICDDFYQKDDNYQYCSCGNPLNPLVCNDTLKNYPYCQCNTIGVHNIVCNMEANSTSQLYYSYDNSHSALSVFSDVVVGGYNLLKNIPNDLTDLWAWFKKYGWIVLIVLVIIIGLPFIIGAINTTKEIFHLVHPDGTTTTHTESK